MANKRMLSLKIIDTDAFLDMPVGSQNLYFHMSTRADDDGFVSNPKKIMRMVGSQEDDLKVLLGKKFIIGFDSGVIVIKHWRIHNLIRNDRYTETQYTEEKSTLYIRDDGAYTQNKDSVKKISPLKKIEKSEWQKNREKEMKNSNLPYSFNYKIREAFIGEPCPICNCEMKSDKFTENLIPTIQHNKPISKGGKHEIDNISVVCRSCNTSTGNNETGKLNNKKVKDVWHTIGNQSATQDRIGKVRKGKVNITSSKNDDVVNKIFDIFYQSINPTINFGNKTNRKACQELIDRFGENEVKRMTAMICEAQQKGDQFCPTATTPYQMKEKLGQFKIYFNKNTNNNIKL